MKRKESKGVYVGGGGVCEKTWTINGHKPQLNAWLKKIYKELIVGA